MASKATISALRSAYSLASLAYWKNETHCGSDLEPEGPCKDCQHWHACVLSAAFHESIAIAEAEGGD